MNRLTRQIIAQREAGLISFGEARAALRRLAKQSRFNADYSDSPESFTRWTNEARAADLAADYAVAGPRHPSRGTLADAQDAREFYQASS